MEGGTHTKYMTQLLELFCQQKWKKYLETGLGTLMIWSYECNDFPDSRKLKLTKSMRCSFNSRAKFKFSKIVQNFEI